MKIHFIINSRSSAAADSGFDRIIRDRFAEHEPVIERTAFPGHAAELARTAVQNGVDLLVAVGGDGTVHEIVNGAGKAEIPIGIIPAGSANDLARHLGIPDRREEACDVILDGNIRRRDIIEVNHRRFLTTCGIGVPCTTLMAAQTMARSGIVSRGLPIRLGHRIYMLGMLAVLFRKMQQFTAHIQGADFSYTLPTISLIFGNQPVLGRYFRTLPGAVDSDGLLDLYLIEGGGRILLMRHLIGAMRGTQSELPHCRMLQTEGFRLTVTPSAAFFGDGEWFPRGSFFDVRIRKKALSVIAPMTLGGRS